jgi:hypothetical protein
MVYNQKIIYKKKIQSFSVCNGCLHSEKNTHCTHGLHKEECCCPNNIMLLDFLKNSVVVKKVIPNRHDSLNNCFYCVSLKVINFLQKDLDNDNFLLRNSKSYTEVVKYVYNECVCKGDVISFSQISSKLKSVGLSSNHVRDACDNLSVDLSIFVEVDSRQNKIFPIETKGTVIVSRSIKKLREDVNSLKKWRN